MVESSSELSPPGGRCFEHFSAANPAQIRPIPGATWRLVITPTLGESTNSSNGESFVWVSRDINDPQELTLG
jgi:hypothetical protein